MITNQLLRQTRFWGFCLSLLVFHTSLCQQPPWRLAAGTQGRYFSAVTVYPSNPDTLYAIGQGFFRSTDQGEHWDSIANVGAVAGALKADPHNSQIIYASTNGPSGNLIQVSTNGGLTWQVKFIGLQCAAPIVEIDPADQRTVYVGVAPSRIMRSSNYGQTWDTLPSPPIFCINDFKIAPSNDSIIYAAYSEGIHKSVDKGNTWTQTAFPTYAHFLAVHPKNPQIVYAAVQSLGNEPRGVYKTTNGGDSWTQTNNGLDSLQGLEWVIGDIAVSPNDPDELFLGNPGPKYLFRSTNGGISWSIFNNGILGAGHVETILIDTLTRRSYVGTARGIYLYDWLTDIKGEEPQLVQQYLLEQNYPNPFNPTTVIKYQLPQDVHVVLKVYDILGREVTTLVDAQEEAGFHSIQFQATGLASGVYFYRLQAGHFTDTKKLMLLR